MFSETIFSDSVFPLAYNLYLGFFLTASVYYSAAGMHPSRVLLRKNHFHSSLSPVGRTGLTLKRKAYCRLACFYLWDSLRVCRWKSERSGNSGIWTLAFWQFKVKWRDYLGVANQCVYSVQMKKFSKSNRDLSVGACQAANVRILWIVHIY